MPLNLPDKLPAIELLKEENIFVIDNSRATRQDIRPLRIVILNLMPLKITTETDLVRLLSNTPLQVEISFMKIKSHTSKNTPIEHMKAFYTDFDKMRDEKYDGMIITGAPVEQMDFEEVTYWDEITEIFDWARTHVTSTLYICWAAQAGLYHHYGVPKYPLDAKMFGIFAHRTLQPLYPIFRGFDDVFYVPHSRHTEVRKEDILKVPGLTLLSESEEAGVYMVMARNGREFFVTGHSEYSPLTLDTEYAPKFGARAAAVNSLEDIAALVAYAHLYNVRIYVTVNTILKEEELAETEKMIWELYRIGVDALIVQDMGITRLNLPPIPLHGSTQMDNRTPEKVRFLADAGFRQVVLARELSLQEIRRIHEACPETPLEVFVHGALCVSYSGQCYVSQACFGRSANRGECAQFCRLPFSLVDADGKTIVRDKHLLSLKDLNQSEVLEDLLDAGASSLKIEGRLKDVSYVKNVTAAYRSKLDAIFARRKEYVRASSGTCRFDFTPRLDKSFSRGFTHYFLQGRDREISSFDTPKSLGEEMGTMKEQRGNYLTVAGVKPFHNGDGVCFLDEQGRLQGFRINRVDGNKLYPAGDVPRIKPRTRLFRNFDQEFERILARKSAERKIGVGWELADTPSGFALTAADEDGNRITLSFLYPKELARTPQSENLRTQLGKLGNTPFEVMPLGGTDSPSATTAPAIAINLSQNWFIPASVIADWRRQAIDKLTAARRITYRRELHVWKPTRHSFPATSLTYLGNVMNTAARSFYQAHGVASVEPAYEKQAVPEAVLMFCKHCLRYSMGWCPTYQKGHSPYREPYYLVGTDGKRFRLTFDCKNCQMKVSS